MIPCTTLIILGFVFISVTFGPRLLSILIKRVEAAPLAQPSASMTLIVSTGLLCGVITQWIGIHAILGFFLAGIIVGSAKGISENIRDSISNTLHAIIVPIFFATLGLKIDFFEGLNLWPTQTISRIVKDMRPPGAFSRKVAYGFRTRLAA